MSRKKDERQNRIRAILDEKNSVLVSELAKELKVSAETIRKDLDELESEGYLKREHGKARKVLMQSEIPWTMRFRESSEDKARIAYEAINRIEDGMVVYLDAGSTLLAGIEPLRSKKDLTIVVNSIPVALKALEMDFRVLFLGGSMLKNGQRTEGYFAEEMLDKLHLDLAILGSCGIKGADGFGVFADQEIGTRRHIIDRSDKVIMVMDSSKFNHPANYQFCRFDEADELITNPLTKEQRQAVSSIQTITEV